MDMSLAPSSWWFDQLDFLKDCLADSPIAEKEIATVVIDARQPWSLSDQSNSNTATTPNLTTHNNCHTTQPNKNCPLSPNFRPNINDTLNYSPETCKTYNNNNNHNVEWLEKCVSQTNEIGSNMDTDHEGDGKRMKKAKRKGEGCHNHIIAERKRRQNLSQCFIALSALVPGLKKMDKTTILGEAINHMKQLKDSVKMLEEESENARSSGVKSAVLVRRSQVFVSENETNSSSLSSSSSSTCLNKESTNSPYDGSTDHEQQVPEIEARFSDMNVLIKIHCAKQQGLHVRILSEIERLHLFITTTSLIPFNDTHFDISIMAKMESEFDMRPEDVVKSLLSVFQ